MLFTFSTFRFDEFYGNSVGIQVGGTHDKQNTCNLSATIKFMIYPKVCSFTIDFISFVSDCVQFIPSDIEKVIKRQRKSGKKF